MRRILHCFNWTMKDVEENLSKIKDSGFTAVQIGPIQQCKEGKEHWKLYQPTSFWIGNRLGTYEDFVVLCSKAHEMGLQVYVDVVLRHMAGKENGEMLPSDSVDYCIKDNSFYWMYSNGNGTNVNDRWQIINQNWGMPTLNYYNTVLWSEVFFPFLDEVLKNADGIRIDQMKHIALPFEGCNLLEEIRERYQGKYIYGEAINLPTDMLEKYSGYADVLIGEYEHYYNKHQAVYFFESHDTFLDFGYTRWMDDNTRLNKWLTLVTGCDNTIYFARPNDNTIFCDYMKYINKNY